MSTEHRGPWREVSRCRECEGVVGKNIRFMSDFFCPVCPLCGAKNTTSSRYRSGPDTFKAVTAREVTRGFFRRFIRWEFRNEIAT